MVREDDVMEKPVSPTDGDVPARGPGRAVA